MEPGARTSSETVVAILLHHTERMKAESCGRSGKYICYVLQSEFSGIP